MAEQASIPATAPARPPAAQPDSEAQTILILGALAIPFVVTGPFAWYMGSQYVKRCKAQGRQPDAGGETGRILGMVATILWGTLIGMYVLMVVAMFVIMIAFYVLFFGIMFVIMLAAAVAGV